MKSLKILVIDDERRIRNEIREFLTSSGHAVFTTALISDADKVLANTAIDIVILDIRLPEINGLLYLKQIKKKYPEIEVIMITAHGDLEGVIEAMRNGAFDFFVKPFRLLDIQRSIEKTEKFIQLNNKFNELKFSYDLLLTELNKNFGIEIIGNSPSIAKIKKLMVTVAKTDNTSVLICGDTGTGKELVARGIHHLSKRKKKYFHSVNCAAIPESLFESEFFGFEKASFTNATDSRAGWFEVANKGTLFLDEISEIPSGTQAKLLRVLEERKVNRLGSRHEIPVDIRIISATNKSARELENKFLRKDLYYRLNTIVINIPPLNERKEDIPLLLHYYAGTFSRQLKKKIRRISDAVVSRLVEYPFPGNIRELKNMIERALILCEGDNLTISHFPALKTDHPDIKSFNNQTYDLQTIEKNHITQVLTLTNFNRSKAARLLNISWQSLDRKMKKLNIRK